jgi:hypothetical protein
MPTICLSLYFACMMAASASCCFTSAQPQLGRQHAARDSAAATVDASHSNMDSPLQLAMMLRLQK